MEHLEIYVFRISNKREQQTKQMIGNINVKYWCLSIDNHFLIIRHLIKPIFMHNIYTDTRTHIQSKTKQNKTRNIKIIDNQFLIKTTVLFLNK